MKSLAKFLMFIVCFLMLCTPCTHAKKQTEFKIQKGVNIGIWLSQSTIMDDRRETAL